MTITAKYITKKTKSFVSPNAANIEQVKVVTDHAKTTMIAVFLGVTFEACQSAYCKAKYRSTTIPKTEKGKTKIQIVETARVIDWDRVPPH